MTYRLRNIAIAVALAVLAAMIVSFYVKQQKQDLQRGQTLTAVYVAKEDIPAGTPGSEIASKVERVEVAKDAAAPGAIVEPSDLEGKVSTDQIYANEQVSLLRFSNPTEQGVRAKLTGTLRAVQVPGDEHQLLAGTLKDGDRVDLVANLKYKLVNFGRSGGAGGAQENSATRTVLRDVLVLQATEASGEAQRLSSDSKDKFVVLALTDAQSQKLFFVMKNGDWTLELRPVKDPADSPESIETVGTVLGDGLSRAQLNVLLFRLNRAEGSE
jgi:Flp pilus assembly protein CpaB